MAEIFANNASGTLASEAASGDTTMTVEAGHTFPSPGASDFFRATLWEVSGGEEINHEILHVTDVTSNTLTVERAKEGTSARTWPVGTSIELRLTAEALNALPPVESVAGKTGAVTLNSGDVGLGYIPTNIRTTTSALTIAAGDLIRVDSSGGAFTIAAPPSPNIDDVFDVVDIGGSLETNPVTVDRNGENIMGLVEDINLNLNNRWFRFLYRGATPGWRVTT